MIYPFIVNDPGEAAQAKRRIGAVTLGHLPPPLVASAAPPRGLLRLERLLDEYSTADGLDPARRNRLIAAIRDEAQASGVDADLGLPPTPPPAEAITRIDRFVCDMKESQFGHGLHVFGAGRPGETRTGLLAALDGRRVAARPGRLAQPRARSDVLPTGRNLFSVDPRAVPSRNAHAQGVKLAEELIRRHLQDHGDYPRGLVVDLWGSRHHAHGGRGIRDGAAPGRPRAALGRRVGPRLGLRDPAARDARPPPHRRDPARLGPVPRRVPDAGAAVRGRGRGAVRSATRPPRTTPTPPAAARVFGPKPGLYGLGMGTAADTFTDEARAAAGEAWLTASAWAIGTRRPVDRGPRGH